jgi:pimeloyl-ACP methyl ester carboxylesterase
LQSGRRERRLPHSHTGTDVPDSIHLTSLPPYEIHTVELGSGAETVVLLHGLSGSSRWWSRSAPGLAGSYRVLMPDLVGFGRSPAAGRLPSPDDTADLLARWLTRLEVETTHLVGHSMGGQIAVHFAVRHPDRLRRLVLVDPAGLPRPLSAASAARFAMEIAGLWRWGDPRFLPTIVGDAWKAGPRTLLRAIGHILRDDVGPLLPRVRAPTLVIWGEYDSWVPLADAAEFRAKLPHARLAVLRGASHNPMVDRPADFNRLVLHFLQGAEVGH